MITTQAYAHVCAKPKKHVDKTPMTKSGPGIKTQNITSADVARLAGVSRSTVSRCFKKDSRISDNTRKRVLEISDQLGYQVNKLARSMSTKESDLVGLVSSGLHDPFAVILVDQLISTLQKMGLHPILLDASNETQLDISIKKLAQYQVKSIVITSGSPSSSIGAKFINRDIPVILLNRAGQLDQANLINCDNQKGAMLAAQALIDAGHKKLAFINSSFSTFSGVSRRDFFEQTLALKTSTGDVTLEKINVDETGYEAGFKAALKTLSQPDHPTGFFCATDNIAFGFMDAARYEMGKKIPDDVSVIGFDDLPLSARPTYDLTTIKQCPNDLAKAVAECIDKIDSTSERTRKIIPVSLIKRKTITAPPQEPSGKPSLKD
ncbi:hypothetical protein WH96_11480 [Kiloniella spongiae]|uniref:HTH lacI-type domain-containing protein n=1 Tax=Kiloniella spongiae TaxID=1489064 RepID=A0A0H2MCR9_9PROT|nr:LacI family DNA-binding transcriptional regulator [Kiloniella spongiae]KLN60369.1 hypothetical protein WH96_11480 [Kiloniella spongiae]